MYLRSLLLIQVAYTKEFFLHVVEEEKKLQ